MGSAEAEQKDGPSTARKEVDAASLNSA